MGEKTQGINPISITQNAPFVQEIFVQEIFYKIAQVVLGVKAHFMWVKGIIWVSADVFFVRLLKKWIKFKTHKKAHHQTGLVISEQPYHALFEFELRCIGRFALGPVGNGFVCVGNSDVLLCKCRAQILNAHGRVFDELFLREFRKRLIIDITHDVLHVTNLYL